MQRATISVSEGRFPEAHFGNRRIIEPSIGYAITRLSAQARSLGTGITVEVDDRGTRLSLTIDADGSLHTPPGAWAQAGAPTESQSDWPSSRQALPGAPEAPTAPQQSGLAPEGTDHEATAQDQRRTFTHDWRPAPAISVPDHPAPPRTGADAEDPRKGGRSATRLDGLTPEPRPNGSRSTLEHSNRAVAPHSSPTRPGSRTPRTRPVRAGVIATLIVAAFALCGAGLLLF